MSLKRRGVGTVVALLYTVLILISGVSIYYTISLKNQEYRFTLNAMEQINFDQGLEDLLIIGNPFNESNHLNMTVLNSGNIDTRITFLAVFDPQSEEPVLQYTSMEKMLLRPHQNRTITGLSQTFPGGYKETQAYRIQLVTSRGTIIEHLFPRPVPPPPEIMTVFIGPFHFGFDTESFNYTSSVQTAPTGAWEMRDDAEDITFNIKITNYGDESITINGLSYLELVVHEVEDACSPSNSGCYESEIYFYIVDPSSTQDNLVAYNKTDPIIVEPDETTILKFASTEAYKSNFHEPGILQGYKDCSPCSPDPVYHYNPPGTENLLWSFIALFWEYPGTDRVYGKTIPFTAVHLEEYVP
jgi:hypothetical protein